MSKNTTKKPTHEHFIVEAGNNNDKAFWHKIGVGWMNDEGVISSKFFAAPLNGELVTLPAQYKKK